MQDISHQYLCFVEKSFGLLTRPLPFLAPLQITSSRSIMSCLSSSAQVILLLSPVPKSTMMCLFLKKNIHVHWSKSSYIELKSGTSFMSTRQKTANLYTASEHFARISSCLMQLGSASEPKRMQTTLSSSLRIAWSTSQPLSKCGKR